MGRPKHFIAEGEQRRTALGATKENMIGKDGADRLIPEIGSPSKIKTLMKESFDESTENRLNPKHHEQQKEHEVANSEDCTVHCASNDNALNEQQPHHNKEQLHRRSR